MQSTIDQHLGNLLYYHECVVVPNFGAFLTRYFPAEINSATHMMRPPSKRVAFNARVNENDGLLAKHIAAVDGVSYEKAIESIEISVRSWKKVFRAGKKVNLIGIGRLYMDSMGKLQFNPAHDINYDLHSYGLNIFRANAMEREAEIKKSVNKAIEKHQGKKVTNRGKSAAKGTKEPSKTNWLKWVATLGPVAALLIVGSYYYTQERETFNNVSGFVLDIFETNKPADEASDEANIEESSSLSFEEAEKLNKNFGPEDDILSEIETESVVEESLQNAEEPVVTEIAAASIEEAIVETNSAAVETVEPVEGKESETITEQPNKETKVTTEPLVNYDYNAFAEKPLYNVKKRPDSLSRDNYEETERGNPYSSLNQRKLNSQKQSSAETRSTMPKVETPATTKIESPKDVRPITSSAVNRPVEAGSFQIIVGAFSDANNARNYVSQLQAQGFDAYISESSRLNRVAIGSFPSADAASESLTKIKRDVAAGAWLNAL